MLTLERLAGRCWAVLVDGSCIGTVVPLRRGHGWRAALSGEWATGRYPTRLAAADALVTRHASLT